MNKKSTKKVCWWEKGERERERVLNCVELLRPEYINRIDWLKQKFLNLVKKCGAIIAPQSYLNYEWILQPSYA